MEFQQYIELAMRTNPKGKSFKDNVMNGIAGLIEEYVEFLYCEDSKTKNELGDLYWYLALLYHATNITPSEITTSEVDVLVPLGKISQHFKKHFYQGHDYNSEIVSNHLNELKQVLDLHCKMNNYTPSIIFNINIEKLLDRYPNGFDPDKSINRKEE